MKRFFCTVACCTSLLFLLSYFLFPGSSAAENPLLVLLNLPAPPPPNPQVSLPSRTNYPANIFSKSNPPPDDAPIDVLMEYWRTQAQDYNEIRHKVYPSGKALDRLLAAIAKDPDQLTWFLSILPPESRSAEFVKGIYDGIASGSENGDERRARLKQWMKYNTPYFSTELTRDASRVTDNEGYVTHHRELLALARVDWERAGPIVARLYSNPANKASQTAALWALYLHAIASGSPGDTDRYRDELKDVVADKSLSAGIRDLALDALSLEKEWSGRDEWYVSLMEDETLLELGGYTGLTTLIISSPEEKYIDWMISLLESDNINVRSAAARNLIGKLNTDRPEIIRALLPWVSNSKWLKLNTSGRGVLLQALSRVKVPDSVPALIAALDEKAEVRAYASGNANDNAMDAAVRAMNAAANAVAAAANAAADDGAPALRRDSLIPLVAANAANIAAYGYAGDAYPLRQAAISALAYQADPRAVPALRRLLGESDQPYLSASVVAAIFHCGGFPTGEQVDALESIARDPDALNSGTSANMVANAPYRSANTVYRPNFTIYDKDGRVSTDVKHLLGAYLAQLDVVKDDLARAVVERIGSLDRSDAKTAQALRKIVMRWPAPAVYALLLGDLKNNRTDPEAIVHLLSLRRTLRETQPTDVFEIRTGSQIALGVSACLLEVPSDFDSILDGGSDEAKTAMLACGRLIRAPLPVAKVAENLHSKDKLLALAAERYLESEDSPEARRIVLSLHPNEAKIMGATTAFFVDGNAAGAEGPSLYSLFATVSPFYERPRDYGYAAGFQQIDAVQFEQSVKDEIGKTPDLLGVYNWKENFVHIYKDKAVLSWRDDPARYRERVMSRDEFDNFKGLIAHYKADDLPPFLDCHDCEPRQLLMLGRHGGRRVFVMTESLPPFFVELERMFADLRQPPAAVKYWAGKDVPGLEVLFADDRLDAIAVWKNGTDFRLLTADKALRQEIDREIAALSESLEDGDDEGLEQSDRLETDRLKRLYENFGWFAFAAGTIGSQVTQPVDVPFIPAKDTLDVAPSAHQWKARAAALEVRSDENALYKVVAGKARKIRTGSYTNVVVTANGRWAIATKYDDEHGGRLVRINLLTNREYVIDPGELPAFRPIAFVSSINRVLVGPHEFHHVYDGHDEEEEAENEDDGGLYSLLGADTGNLIPARGEVRPLVQQTFRPLQTASTAFEYWAAIPKDKGTVVGIYNTRNFNIKPVLTLPNLTFDSMDIWVDAAEGKLYFVYEGHLLAAPIKVGR